MRVKFYLRHYLMLTFFTLCLIGLVIIDIVVPSQPTITSPHEAVLPLPPPVLPQPPKPIIPPRKVDATPPKNEPPQKAMPQRACPPYQSYSPCHPRRPFWRRCR